MAALALVLLLVPGMASADLSSRRTRPFRPVVSPRIVHVETLEDQLFIFGESLPTGAGLAVLLGGHSLRVLSSDRSRVVAALPSPPPSEPRELVVERGTRRAVYRGRGLSWGLRFAPRPGPPRDALAKPRAEASVPRPPVEDRPDAPVAESPATE